PQNQARRKMLFYGDVLQFRLSRELLQLTRLEAPQDRKRAILANQSVVQKQPRHRREEKIRHCVTMQIDHKDSAARDATHFTQKFNDMRIAKVMREQRANDVFKLLVNKRKPKSIATH